MTSQLVDNSETRPLPMRLHDETKPFWEGCKKHQLLLQKCKSCGKYQYPPRILCANCWAEDLEWEQISGNGVIHSFSVVHMFPMTYFQRDVPYCIALVDLEEGPRMLSRIVSSKLEDVKIGKKVRVVFEDVTEEVTLPNFRLVTK